MRPSDACGLMQSSLTCAPPPPLLCAGGLPAGWAANGSFAALKVASLAGNPLGGPLPPAWGDAEYSLPALQSLDVSSTGLTGTLPAEWGAGLASLQEL